MKNAFCITCLSAMLAMPALADTRLEYRDEKTGKTGTLIYIGKGKVRMDDADSNSYTLYDSTTNTMTFVDHEERSYTVMDEAAMNRMAGQVNAAMEQMRKQLESMPPEQRAQVEKMMGGMMNMGRENMKTHIERTGRHMEYGGYKCEQVFFSVGKLSRSELCVTPMDDLGIPADDRRALTDMQRHMQKMAEKMTSLADFGFDPDEMGGLPVYTRNQDEAAGDVLASVTHSVESGSFSVPEGYKRTELAKFE